MASSNFTTEKMLKVRVGRMTIQTPKATFVEGEDVEIEESLARQLRSQYFVKIHGEDDLRGAVDDPTVTIRAMLGESETRDVVAGVR
jgi:hypothetical protein